MNRPVASRLIGRALRLRCPRCGGDTLFRGLFRMHAACRGCGLVYEREPGYFLGSIYVNYGLTAMLTTVMYALARFVWQLPARPVLSGLAAFCVLFPAFFFRYARALWLAMDCRFDRSLFAGRAPSPERSSHEPARPERGR